MIEVLTPDGFKPFHGIKRKTSVAVNFQGTECTLDHQVMLNGAWTQVGELISPDDELAVCEVYDLLEVEGHAYYTDDKISHNCGFLGSSGTLISPAKLQQMVAHEPIKLLGDNREFKIYKDPIPDHQYVLTVDVSEGVGKDYSVISVIDVTEAPFEQVAMMRSNIMSPLLLSDLANRTGLAYNNAVIVVESNTYGKQVTDSLWYDYEYENMLITKPHQQDAKITGAGQKSQPGVKTSKKTKLLGCSALKGLVESNQLLINDAETIYEFSTFIKKGTSYQAEQGKCDDIVMSLVIFAWFSSQPYFGDMIDANVRLLVRDNLLQQDEYTTAFGFLDDGTDDSEISHSLFYSLVN